MNHDDFIVSETGVVVWKKPGFHPLLKRTDLNHPDFIRKAHEHYGRGRVQCLPRICSENSEDACTWFYFSPLLHNVARKTWVVARLLREAFPGQVSNDVFAGLPTANLYFWQGRHTPTLLLPPPPSRNVPEGHSEVDVIVTIGSQAVVFVEAKYQADVAANTTHDPCRDQVIRNMDVGSWFAKERFERFYFLIVQYGDHPSNAKDMVNHYLSCPDRIREKLPYRSDLTLQDLSVLSRSIGFVRWPDPMGWSHILNF